jgi:hypothetical protein
MWVFLPIFLGLGLYDVYADHQLQCTAPAHVGRYFYDACLMRCECIQPTAGLFDFRCFREREDYSCMDDSRRQRFNDAYVQLSDPDPSNPLYGQFSYLMSKHGAAFSAVHATRWFLPWHRAYLLELENLLRKVDCRITVPYWPFASNPTDPFSYGPFGDLGMGSNGDPGNNNYVSDGKFGIPWIPPSKSTFLTRQFLTTPIIPTLGQLNQILSTPASGFASFSDQLKFNYHNGVHVSIGGDMGTVASPLDPIFFLVHGNVDRAWDTWQKMSADRSSAYGSFSATSAMPFMFGTITFNDVRSLETQGIRYVQAMSDPLGRNHSSSLPTCSLVRLSSGWVSTQMIETRVLSAQFSTLSTVSQVAPQAMSPEQQETMTMMMPPEMRVEHRAQSKQFADQVKSFAKQLKKKFTVSEESKQSLRTKILDKARESTRGKEKENPNFWSIDIDMDSSDDTDNLAPFGNSNSKSNSNSNPSTTATATTPANSLSAADLINLIKGTKTKAPSRPSTLSPTQAPFPNPKIISLAPESVLSGIDLDELVKVLGIPVLCPPDAMVCETLGK